MVEGLGNLQDKKSPGQWLLELWRGSLFCGGLWVSKTPQAIRKL